MARTAPPTPLKLHLLGPFRVESAKGPLPLPARKDQSLLAYLVLHPQPCGHTREKLAALLWGDSPDAQARGSLRTALKNLRQHLGTHLVRADRETVHINPAFPLWVDAREFEAQVRGAPESAITLYRGDLLADLYDEWIFPEREHYRELYLNALLQLTQTHRAAGEYQRAIEYAHKVLAADPANERAHQHLMFCDLALGDRSAALKQYDACVRALQTEFAVEPSRETTALYHWMKHAPSERRSLAAQITNLPIPLSSFIGRKQEGTELKERITTTRLLTLTGAGGSGKTRLAIQVATDLIDQFHDGVWWVDLAPLMDEALVSHAVAQALGVREAPNQPLTETLTIFLRHKQLLLVLDNCEHLIAACTQLADGLLTHCATLRILTTSREALGVTGEMVYHVRTLALPKPQRLTLTDVLMEYEGIHLFVERACAVKSDFALTEQNAAAVVRICQRLDGIPLALELAAARTKVLTVEHIAERLNDRFNLLTQGSRTALPRQQTLRATLDWSHDLLTEGERILFRRLSVFAGGFTLEAAEGVCSEAPLAPRALLDLLARLIDRSLVKVEPQGEEARYRLLETIREYAREKLDESGEMGRLRDRHSHYFLRLAEEAGRELRGPHQLTWLYRLGLTRDNVRAALEWIIETGQTEMALRMARQLSSFWFMRSDLNEARQWLGRAVALPDAPLYPESFAGALAELAHHTWLQRGARQARPIVEQALAVSRAHGDLRNTAHALAILGLVLADEYNFEAAQSVLEESQALFREVRDEWGYAHAVLVLGLAAEFQGDDANTLALHEQGLAQFRKLGDRYFQSVALHHIGDVRIKQGDWMRGQAALREALILAQDLGSKYMIGTILWSLAKAAHRAGDPACAVRLHWAARKMFDSIGVWRQEDAAEFEKDLARCCAALGEPAFMRAVEQGRAMTLEQALGYALAETEANV